MSDLPPSKEVANIIENMPEVDIFDVEEKCAFLCISVGFKSQLQEDFGIPNTILKF